VLAPVLTHEILPVESNEPLQQLAEGIVAFGLERTEGETEGAWRGVGKERDLGDDAIRPAASAAQRYPVLYLLHGNSQSAHAFLEIGLQGELDALIARHAIPPLIAVMIVAPHWY